MNLEITIDALHVDGLPAADLGTLGAALEGELTRLVAERGVPAGYTGGEIAIDTVRVDANAGADAVGVQIAQAIFRGLTRGDDQ